MITWLDHFSRQAAKIKMDEQQFDDPRKALAFLVAGLLWHAKYGSRPFDSVLDEAFYVLLSIFVAELLPQGGRYIFADGSKVARPLGLLLTRPTANLLSATAPINMPDDLWRAELGTNRAIYIDIPHGAILLNANPGKDDMVQLRAIFAAPFLPLDMPGHTLFIAQMTGRASEQGRGRIAGVLTPDGSIKRFGSADTGATAADWTMKPPFVHSLLERAVLGRAGSFLRLVLAYHFFGPKEAREPVAATPTGRLRDGKPRKDESLFALTRLNAPDAMGRPSGTISASWSLTSRQEVAGHFKLQAHGPQLSSRRMIWVASYDRGPEDAPIRPKGQRV